MPTAPFLSCHGPALPVAGTLGTSINRQHVVTRKCRAHDLGCADDPVDDISYSARS